MAWYLVAILHALVFAKSYGNTFSYCFLVVKEKLRQRHFFELSGSPRRYHPVLAAVSKPIKSLLSSAHFFAVWSILNCTKLLPYLRFRNQHIVPTGLFTVYGRPNDNEKSKIIIALVPGVPNDCLYRSLYAAVGPKIYIGGQTFGHSLTDVWILDCRFHTWDCGPSVPTVERGVLTTTVLDGKIYLIGMWTEEDSWVDVFDTVAGRWEAIPSPKLRAYGKEVVGCDIRGAKVCVWMAEEELRFDPPTKTWEVFESDIGLRLDWRTQTCEVNGVLYWSHDYQCVIKWFDEGIGVWKELKFRNHGGCPNDLLSPRMVNLGGRLVVMGWRELPGQIVTSIYEKKMEFCFEEIEVNKDEDGDLQGEVWSEMVASMRKRLTANDIWFFACIPVSL
ncbi:F-box/kelch-repeat protein SKIP6-like [Morus notabilis]|uniref:F-box/kelch-repeat protein SKIP6-like n=1 Tax=Morus notabilis TaxID=981085 RepID=UPI000CED36E7|nr:F-box/kelch-repeat protein SKIP6-like [Morus notabilis]